MNIYGQIAVIVLMFLLVFWHFRGFFYGIKRYQLNNSAFRKRKKGERFKEWLLYSRYKEEIPRFLRIVYYSYLIAHCSSVVVCLLLHALHASFVIGDMIARGIMIIDGIWALAITILFWQRKPDYAYERWIKKRRGEKK